MLVCVRGKEKEKRKKSMCVALFVKALLPWACRLNMKASLTWQALPEDTSLWTMPGQTWHTAVGLKHWLGLTMRVQVRLGISVLWIREGRRTVREKTHANVCVCVNDSRKVGKRWSACVRACAVLCGAGAPGLGFLCLCLSSNNPSTSASGHSGGD